MRISDWSSDVCSSDLAARRCMGFTSFHDPSGNAIDLVVRPFASGRRYVPGRDAGITGFSHVGLKTTDSRRDEAFWTGLFNFRANDWIGEAALMSFDAVHHRIALFPTERPGNQHVNFQVEKIDDLLLSSHFLTATQVPHRVGQGLHASSGARLPYY